MRIYTESLTQATHSIPMKNQPEADFETVLNASITHPDGEYYRQHQTELQQSALSFTSKPIQATRPKLGTRDVIRTSEKNELFMQRSQEENAHPEALARCLESASDVTSKTTMTSELEALLTVIKKTIRPQIGYGESQIRPHNTHSDCNRSRMTAMRQTQPNSVWKPYQLFINDDNAELSLNTVHLSKIETKALGQYMKQWLSAKGLTLKKLVVNGEQQ